MTGPWKERKTKPRFRPLSTVPWKSGKPRQISTFPPPRLAPDGKVENHKPVSHFPTRRKRRRFLFPSQQKTKLEKGSRPLHGLPIRILFRIILYWKRYLVSGSSLDWKMLRRWMGRTNG
jgi:hypothetical protein